MHKRLRDVGWPADGLKSFDSALQTGGDLDALYGLLETSYGAHTSEPGAGPDGQGTDLGPGEIASLLNNPQIGRERMLQYYVGLANLAGGSILPRMDKAITRTRDKRVVYDENTSRLRARLTDVDERKAAYERSIKAIRTTRKVKGKTVTDPKAVARKRREQEIVRRLTADQKEYEDRPRSTRAASVRRARRSRRARSAA